MYCEFVETARMCFGGPARLEDDKRSLGSCCGESADELDAIEP